MRKTILPLLISFVIWSCSGSKNATQLPDDQVSGKVEKATVAFGRVYADGAKEKILGNYDAALTEFEKALDLDPKSAAANYEIGNIYSIQEKNNEALEQYRIAVKIEPDNYWFQLSLAAMLKDLGRSKEAIERFQTLVDQVPKRIELKYELAQLMLNNDRKSDGIAVMNQVEEELGVTEEVSFLKKRVYLSNNDVDNAAKEIQNLIDQYPDELAYYGVLADVYSSNGRKSDAMRIYKEMLLLDSNNYRLQYSLAEFYRQEGNKTFYKKYLDKAFANSEMSIDDKIKYVLTYYQVDSRSKIEKKEGISFCKKITTAHPDNAKGYALLADFLYFDNQTNEAKKSYIRTLELDSSRFPVWNQLIYIFAEKSDTAELVNYSKRAIDLFPNQPTVYLTYGIGLSQQGNNEEAIEYLKLGKGLVIENQSLKSQFYSSLGDCYHSIKDNANSDKNYNQALELDPNNVIVLNNYSYYLSVRNENLALAKTMSAKSNNLAPNQASFQDTYAWILFQLKEYDNALIWIEKAIENSTTPSGEILEHKGDILFKKNDLTEAVKYWEKAKLKGGASLKIDKKINDKTYYE
jgi:tetratricopeptide (TPR) repeat protein